MPKDGMKSASSSPPPGAEPAVAPPLAARPLGWLTRRLLKRPRLTLAICLALAVGSALLAWQCLGFRTNRLDLLNPSSEFHQRWLDYLGEFGRDDDLVVVLHGADSKKLSAATDRLAAELRRHPDRFRSLIHQRDLGRVRRKALQLLDERQLSGLVEFVATQEALLAGRWEATSPELFPRQIARQLAIVFSESNESGVARAGFTSDPRLARLPIYVANWAAEIEGAATGRPRAPTANEDLASMFARFDELAPHPILLPDGRHGLIALRLTDDDPADPSRRAASIAALRDILREVARETGEVEIGLTGMSVLEDDEMRVSQTDMTWASVFSFLGVVLLLKIGFRAWRPTLLAVATLVIGMAWSFGWIAIFPGHLNLLSVSFAAILIGLGIDFGIHYLSRYLELRKTGASPRHALVDTSESIGPGVITGALTTAVAFLAAAHSEFTGVAELGWIAGAGVLLCVIAALVALPPLVLLADVTRPTRSTTPSHALGRWLARCHDRPELILAFFAAVGAASFGLGALRYDHNLLNLQTDGLESVRLERLLTSGDQRSVWFAVSMTDDLDELRRRKERFERLPSVARVEEIASLATPPSAACLQSVKRLGGMLAQVPHEIPNLPAPSATSLREELDRLVAILSAASRIHPQLAPLADRLSHLRATLASIPDATLSARLAGWRQKTLDHQRAILVRLREFADPTPLDWADLPDELVARFRGSNGRHLLRVYAREDVWDLEPLRDFVHDLESVDARVTGHPVQTFYASQQVQRSYLHSGVYALICVLIVTYLDFRHLGHALLSLVPLVVSFVLTFGLAGWLRMPMNAANLLVLPLLLGIALDAGVHILHDWRSQTGRYVMNPSLGLSILLCSATTIAGFAGLAFARHQGLRSLGILLCLGMTISLATALVFLPACLRAFAPRQRRPRRRPQQVPPT